MTSGVGDRGLAYDHVGRIKEAYTGREARGLAPNNPADSPYRQSFSYDAWNDLSPTGRHWTAPVADTPAYTNKRRSDWTYNANGDVTSRDSGQRTHTYDAAGQQRSFYEEGLDSYADGHFIWHQFTINQTYDAHGRVGKRVDSRHTEDENGVLEDYTETNYQLRSTVLGGAHILDIDQWGNRVTGRVYIGGELLAEYQYSAPDTITTIQHRNPTTGQWVKSAVRAEPDPLGAESGYNNPYTSGLSYADMIAGEGLYYMRGNAMDIRGGCALDGLPVSCSQVNEAIMSETSSVALEYQLNDGTILPEQGRIQHFGAGLVLYDHPFVELDNEPGNVPYRVGWRTGVLYAHPQKPVPQLAPDPGQPLSPCVKNRLRAYFGVNLDDIRVQEGIPDYVVGDPLAYTEGNRIYFKKGRYDPHSVQGLSDIGHEVTHSEQYAKLGTINFQAQYLDQYLELRHLGFDHETAYENISFEVEARKRADIINKDLTNLMRDFGGRDPCPK